jgi:hypothetical protein
MKELETGNSNISRISLHIGLTIVFFTLITLPLAWAVSFLAYATGQTTRLLSMPRVGVLLGIGVYIFVGMLISQIIVDRFLEKKFPTIKTSLSQALFTIFSIIFLSIVCFALLYLSAYFMTYLKLQYWL